MFSCKHLISIEVIDIRIIPYTTIFSIFTCIYLKGFALSCIVSKYLITRMLSWIGNHSFNSRFRNCRGRCKIDLSQLIPHPTQEIPVR